MRSVRTHSALAAVVMVGALTGFNSPAVGAWMPVIASAALQPRVSSLVQTTEVGGEYARKPLVRAGLIATPTPTVAGLGALISCLSLIRPRRV